MEKVVENCDLFRCCVFGHARSTWDLKAILQSHSPISGYSKAVWESLLQPVHPIKHLVLFFCTTRQLPESDQYCAIVSITFFATIFGEPETDILILCCVDRHFVASMLFFLCSTSTRTHIYQAHCELLDSFGHRPKLGGGSQSVEDFCQPLLFSKLAGRIFNVFDPFTISLVLLPHVI